MLAGRFAKLSKVSIQKVHEHDLILAQRGRLYRSKKLSHTVVSRSEKERSDRHIHSFPHTQEPKNKIPPTHQSKSSACSSYSPARPSQHASPSSSSPPYQSIPRALFLLHHTPVAERPLAAPASYPFRPA